MNRRSFLKKALGSLLALVGLSGGTYYYAREIEPAMLHINKNNLPSKKIPSAFNNFKIVQFSDTHIGFHYSLEQFKTLVEKINNLKPDIIVFTGDLVDEPHTYRWNDELISALHTLDAKHGKYWIYGNHDHGGYGTDILQDVMEQANFKLLKNSHTIIEKSTDRFVLAGIDDVMLGRPDLKKTLDQVNPDLFTILLAHEPDYADTVLQYPVDVQLSGHSHGGQVRFPFIGDLYTPSYAEKYVQGKYMLGDKKLTLFVNSGIGTTRLPYRFLCKPEIHLYTLKTE
ncbi:metallophosphoesterase [Virgibacillus indicus]|uniref:Metallophosphoesterase n=1 Tax=Virgibacillus indicus TaxID=2024554 RepID=A0A265NGU6_9BACI|nr:metallophosphoesterase [Virgibacillus indicus]OZU90476.1 metallophosphoesterase [Virgibacillus indicus]